MLRCRCLGWVDLLVTMSAVGSSAAAERGTVWHMYQKITSGWVMCAKEVGDAVQLTLKPWGIAAQAVGSGCKSQH